MNETEITTVTGPTFIVIILNWGLFGVLSIQVYLYSQAFPKDRAMLKALVYNVYLLETAQTLLLTQDIWNKFARGFGQIEELDKIGTSWLSVALIGGLVGFLVQLFYAYRISVISQRRIVPAFIVLLSLASLAGALATAAYSKRATRFSALLTSLSFSFRPLGLWGGAGSACDVIIAACMCYYLRKCRTSTKFTHTQALISRLVRMTIETGVLTASISILTVALYYPPALIRFTYFVVPLSAQAKLYSTTMLAVLNSRMKVEMVSESTSGWRDYELSFSHSEEKSGIRFNVASSAGPSQSTGVFVMKEIVTTNESRFSNLEEQQP